MCKKALLVAAIAAALGFVAAGPAAADPPPMTHDSVTEAPGMTHD